MIRNYHVVCAYSKGTYTWNSECLGFGFFSRVTPELINKWQEYASIQLGEPAAVINFIRIAIETDLNDEATNG